MKKKDKRDGPHKRRGWVGGNPRYKRNRKRAERKDKTMGRN